LVKDKLAFMYRFKFGLWSCSLSGCGKSTTLQCWLGIVIVMGFQKRMILDDGSDYCAYHTHCTMKKPKYTTI